MKKVEDFSESEDIRKVESQLNLEVAFEGTEKLKNLQSNVILILGMKSVGVECCKNLCLTGFQSIFISDLESGAKTMEEEICGNFICKEEFVGKERLECYLDHLQELSTTKVVASDLGERLMRNEDYSCLLDSKIDVVVVCDGFPSDFFLLQEFCTKNDIAFFYARALGLIGCVFVPRKNSPDVLFEHVVEDVMKGICEGSKSFSDEEETLICVNALKEFFDIHKRLPSIFIKNDHQETKRILEGIVRGSDFEVMSRNIVLRGGGNLSYICSFFGGIVSHEIIKYLTGKVHDLNFNGKSMYFRNFAPWTPMEIVETSPVSPAVEVEKMEVRYLGQAMIWGWEFNKYIQSQKIFCIGVGSNGCECLKNLGKMGVGSDFMGLLDMDKLSLSNTVKQLFYRYGDIVETKTGSMYFRMKCEVAAEKLRNMNPDLNSIEYDCTKMVRNVIETKEKRFWKNCDAVFALVDNLEARFLVEERCCVFNVPFFEAGFSGVQEGASDFFIPFQTYPYRAEISSRGRTLEQIKKVKDDDLNGCTPSFPRNEKEAVKYVINSLNQTVNGINNVIIQLSENKDDEIITKISSMVFEALFIKFPKDWIVLVSEKIENPQSNDNWRILDESNIPKQEELRNLQPEGVKMDNFKFLIPPRFDPEGVYEHGEFLRLFKVFFLDNGESMKPFNKDRLSHLKFGHLSTNLAIRVYGIEGSLGYLEFMRLAGISPTVVTMSSIVSSLCVSNFCSYSFERYKELQKYDEEEKHETRCSRFSYNWILGRPINVQLKTEDDYKESAFRNLFPLIELNDVTNLSVGEFIQRVKLKVCEMNGISIENITSAAKSKKKKEPQIFEEEEEEEENEETEGEVDGCDKSTLSQEVKEELDFSNVIVIEQFGHVVMRGENKGNQSFIGEDCRGMNLLDELYGKQTMGEDYMRNKMEDYLLFHLTVKFPKECRYDTYHVKCGYDKEVIIKRFLERKRREENIQKNYGGSEELKKDEENDDDEWLYLVVLVVFLVFISLF